MEDRQFAAIYRWTVEAGNEDGFRERWRIATRRLREEFGALGSCLTRDSKGDFVAFARWPSEAAREAAFAARPQEAAWGGVLNFEETKLWVEDDLLLKP